jgi:hypothetical protein
LNRAFARIKREAAEREIIRRRRRRRRKCKLESTRVGQSFS